MVKGKRLEVTNLYPAALQVFWRQLMLLISQGGASGSQIEYRGLPGVISELGSLDVARGLYR